MNLIHIKNQDQTSKTQRFFNKSDNVVNFLLGIYSLALTITAHYIY